jgi:hypothetical protein
MQPIAPTYREASEGNHTDLCYNVSNTMSHLLWGPEWADTTPMTGKDEKKRAEWQPIWFETDYPYIPTNEEEWEKERLPCEKEDMKKYCNIRAEQLCDIAFGDLGNQGTNDPTKNTTNFHRFSPKDHLNSEDTNSPIFIILALFFFSFLYAGKVHKDHTDRVKARQKRQLEESVSTRHVGSGSQVTPDGEVDMERMMSLEERNNKFFDLMTKKNDKDSTSMAGTIRPWDINFEEQEMEDMYRRMQLGENLLQFRWLLLLGLMVVIGYQLMLTSSRVVIQWELRGLLVFYCTLIIPFTFEATFVKYFAIADIMFSNSMVVISFVFIFISYLDKFKGTPTESFLMMGIVIGLNL